MFRKITIFFALFFYFTSFLGGFFVSANSGDLENTSSGNIEVNLGLGKKLEETQEVVNFEGKVLFQNPSYILDKNQENLSEYNCDSEKSECKINFKFVGFLDGEELNESKIRCETSFGFDTGKENDCNPTTIIFPYGENIVNYKIILKEDESVFEERDFLVKNISSSNGEEAENTQTGEIDNSGTNWEGQNGEIPEISLEIQSGADFGEENLIICPENGEGLCKINFNLLEVDESKFFCEFDFGNGGITGQEKECNPSYIDFGSGIFEIKVKIYEKENEENFREKVFQVKNKNINDSESNSEGQENTQIGNIDNSGTETGTGEVENGQYGEENKDFEIKYNFQNPTYFLEEKPNFGTGKIVYHCDSKKSDCRLNIDFSETFTGGFKEGDFGCKINFGSEILTGEEEKCNPNTVIFGTGKTEVSYKIYHKIEKNYFQTGSFFVENFKNNYSETNPDGKDLEIPEINLEIQSGADFGLDNEIICTKKSDGICKINLNLENSFDSKYLINNYDCEFDFSSGASFSPGTDKKCNPAYIDYGVGIFQIKIKIFEKENKKNLKEKIFILKNTKETSSFNSYSTDNFFENIEKDPKIKIQSGLNENFVCDKKICSINLIYENKNKNLACIWDFGEGDIGKTNIKSCNPGYVKFFSGKHKITLKVYDKNNENNFEKSVLEFENIYKTLKLKSRITLQGKLAKYKILDGNRLICNGVKSCSVNLSGDESSGEIKNYKWDFGNGESFDGKNPKSVIFLSGNYEIILKVFDECGKSSKASFFVEVLEEKIEIEKKDFDLEFFNFLQKYYENLDFVKNKNILEKERKKLIEKFRLYHRKNKKFSTVYGKYLPLENILIEKKINFLDGIFYNKEFLVKVDKKGKFKKKLVYDEAGDFILKAYIFDKNLGKIFAGKRKIQILKEDLKNGEEYLKKKNTDFKGSDKNLLSPVQKGKIKVIPKIIIQGKIGKNKVLKEEKIICIGGKTCSVNFDGRESRGDFVEMFWDFGNGKIFYGKNPKSIKYEKTGKYEVFLKIRDRFGELYEKKFIVEFNKKTKKILKSKKIENKKFGPVKLKITVQGKIGKNKILKENKLTCIGGKTCSINFDGRKSSGSYKKLFWDFGNGKTFSGVNPGYIKYEKLGNYTVKLLAENYNGKKFKEEFKVEFIEKLKSTSNNFLVGTGVKKKNMKIKENYFEGKENKDGKYFILTIIIMILSGSFILLKRYKII